MVLGAKRLGYKAKRLGYGGERLGLKKETKRLGGKRLGGNDLRETFLGETSCYQQDLGELCVISSFLRKLILGVT